MNGLLMVDIRRLEVSSLLLIFWELLFDGGEILLLLFRMFEFVNNIFFFWLELGDGWFELVDVVGDFKGLIVVERVLVIEKWRLMGIECNMFDKGKLVFLIIIRRKKK